MATHKIALLDGDGIGPEIMAEAVKILDLVAQRNDIDFELVHEGLDQQQAASAAAHQVGPLRRVRHAVRVEALALIGDRNVERIRSRVENVADLFIGAVLVAVGDRIRARASKP